MSFYNIVLTSGAQQISLLSCRPMLTGIHLLATLLATCCQHVANKMLFGLYLYDTGLGAKKRSFEKCYVRCRFPGGPSDREIAAPKRIGLYSFFRPVTIGDQLLSAWLLCSVVFLPTTAGPTVRHPSHPPPDHCRQKWR